MHKSYFPYAVIVPVLAFVTLFTMVPIIGSFVIAFFDYNPLRQFGNEFIGLSNFYALFDDMIFVKAFGNTLRFVIVATSLNLLITLPVAQLLCTLPSNRWRSLFRVLFFLPCVAPKAAISIVWQRSLFPIRGGLLNVALTAFGLSSINWLGNAGALMSSVILVRLWGDIGYNLVLLVAGMQGIPRDFYEAAEIDGAGPFRKFFQITLPLLQRTLIFVFIMTVISQFQVFDQFAILAPNGGVAYSGYVLSTYIYDVGFKMKNMGYASAISIVLFAIIMLTTLAQKRMMKVDWGY